MLNDLLSMCVALWAIRVAKKTKYDPKYSYGWQRAEILGALINGVFLLALCFTILIDSIERFASPEPVERPVLVLITGGAGLVANLIGLFLFHDAAHGHGGHSHGGHSHDEHSHDKHSHDVESVKSHSHEGHEGGNLNMRGIFLHVLGDALGNVGVIVSGLIIWLTPYDWRFYFDPILDGIISVHELHVWQLSDTKLIASLHVLLKSRQSYMKLGSQIRKLLHGYGIHSATIQPEFIEDTLDEKAPYVDDADSESKLIIHGIEQVPNSPATNSVVSLNEELQNNSSTCLLRCIEDSCLENNCCPPEQ
ncbi:hypothetical protein HPULCUR_006578 [Helicostylum pulchrum]|uniref:Cation efflux protein transmembrane domain-containing protein n=1 Tax=Helicostylum pulchrum TaxID=562976 RepID=A0ABP9Y2C1_9FUNG